MPVLLAAGFTFCSVKDTTVIHVDLIVNYPVIQIVDKKVHYFNLLDTTGIYYVDDYVVYKLAPNTDLETNSPIAGSEQYFIYKKNNSTGLLFNRLYDTSNVVSAKVDSLLYARASTVSRNNMLDSAWMLFSSEKTDHELTEKFVPKEPSSNVNFLDTLIFKYRNDYPRFDYSFSRYMDSLKNMKMTQFIAKQRSKYEDTSGLVFPEREHFFKLESRAPSSSDSAIVNLVSRFKKRFSQPG